MAGEVGRTPVLVVESTCQPGEKPFTPSEVYGGESSDQRGMPSVPEEGEREPDKRPQSVQEEGEPDWALPQPSEPHTPLKGGKTKSRAPPWVTEEQRERPPEQKYPTPDQRLIEADMRCRRRLAALARDHIMKLREERQRMAYDWLGEYSRQASSIKLKGGDLSALRAEYIHRYNQLLDHERQPHSDFFVNLSLDMEEELDFNEEEPFDLSRYDQYFEWDEAEYMKLQFIVAWHYAS